MVRILDSQSLASHLLLQAQRVCFGPEVSEYLCAVTAVSFLPPCCFSKSHKRSGRKIIWSFWFDAGAAHGHTYDVGLKAKAREHSSKSLPATANGI